MTSREYIYLSIEAEKCQILTTCNGIPVVKKQFDGKSIHSIPINTYLIKNNQLLVTVIPIKPSDISTENPHVKVQLKNYDQNTFSVSPETGEILVQSELIGFTTKTIKFKNTILDFTTSFQDLMVINDEKEITEFAKKLDQHFISQNSIEISRLFQPKLNDFAKGYYENQEQYSDGFQMFLQNEFFSLGLMQTDSAIVLSSFLDKKVWQITYFPDFEFIRSNPDEGNTGFTIEIFIAKIRGEIMVIR